MSKIYIINACGNNINNQKQLYFWRIEIRGRNDIICHEPAFAPYQIDRSMAAFMLAGARASKSIEVQK